jgi:hypothetical protein
MPILQVAGPWYEWQELPEKFFTDFGEDSRFFLTTKWVRKKMKARVESLTPKITDAHRPPPVAAALHRCANRRRRPERARPLPRHLRPLGPARDHRPQIFEPTPGGSRTGSRANSRDRAHECLCGEARGSGAKAEVG